MKIKSKILCALLAMSLLVALVGALAVDRQRASAMVGVTKEAENVARVLSFLVSDTNNLPASVQKMVMRLHQTERRDVVLVNSQKRVLADANPLSVGKIFTEDPGDEIGATMKDRKVRTFVETGREHPAGIKQIVVPVETESGQVLGAVVLEYTPLYDELVRLTKIATHQIALAALGSTVIALLVAFFMSHSIVVPLQQLTDVATGLASGKTDLPMPPPRKDEIGELANAFKNMLQKRMAAEEELRRARDDMEARVKDRTKELESTHKELLEVSRQAGMAEVATGILHNVGNVLNSVNVASSCVADSLRKSKVASLSKVVALLREHQSDLGNFLTTDAKGKQLPGYLGQLAEHLAREQTGALRELSELQKNIEHIKDIVTMQQRLAKASSLKEELQVSDLVEDALRMNASTLSRHDILVIKEFKDMPPVMVEKHKVLQILVNLMRNAKQACSASGLEDKRMTIRTTNQNGGARISVCDNGVGILPENLTRIFAHGFTTKEDGHGFGLHSGALAAKEMGGSLTVHSDGHNRGATFTLELPNPTTEGSNG
jgi:signal transduction histidine kinase